MNSQNAFLEPQYPIWAGAGRLYGIQALSPVSDEDAVFHVFSNVFSEYEHAYVQGLVETKPREVVRGLPDHGSNTELGGDKKW